MIVYYTGTGNSRWAAKYLAALLDDSIQSAGAFLRNSAKLSLDSDTPWVFVSPTYAWRLPRLFAELLESGSFYGCRDAYFVMTCGTSVGGAARYLQPLCEKCGLHFSGLLPLVMPENYVAMFEIPGEEESRELVLRAEEPLKKAADLIRQGSSFPEVAVTPAGRLKSAAINPLFYRFEVTAKPFYATEKCISCGKCAKVCPLRNIALAAGKPHWGGRCTHCMACICDCPTGAIEYGKKTVGKPRYHFPDGV